MNEQQIQFLKEMARIFEVTELPRSHSLKSIDSLGRAEVITYTEEIFGISLSNEEILKCQTFGDVEDIIKAKTHA